jgi:hypothetical protein
VFLSLFLVYPLFRFDEFRSNLRHSLHVGAWFARILAAAGVTQVTDLPQALKQLESNFPDGEKVGAKTERWAENLFERKSFKQVYADGMH